MKKKTKKCLPRNTIQFHNAIGHEPDARKNRQRKRRKESVREQESAPGIIASSIYDLTVKPKAWVEILEKSNYQKQNSDIIFYKQLVDAYNHGAALMGKERIEYKKSDTSPIALANVYKKFKENICPKGFDVNIDQYYHKKKNEAHNCFSMYKEIEFPSYWHFFEIRHIVKDLARNNKKLHDLFIVFLRVIYWALQDTGLV